MDGKLLLQFALGLSLCAGGCAAAPPLGPGPSTAQTPVPNPIFVATNSADPNAQLFVSERAVDVLAKYNFEIDPANQLEGTIATQYKVGSGILEPWHRESIGLDNRLESTFQPIRRKILVHVVRADGGFLVSVEALKEIEDLPTTSAHTNTPGGSTFIENYPLRRDLNVVLGQATPSGWLPRGHDVALEQAVLCKLQAALGH